MFTLDEKAIEDAFFAAGFDDVLFDEGCVGRRANLSHTLGATKFLELKRLVLHGKFVTALTFAIEPFQDFRCKAKSTAQKPTKQGLDH